ncbi:B3 domain-containing protein Os03g0212300-like isoform X2 [Oryza glaberrima]|uniref:B3 domain-containing protein Os03g0212300-like isoform X2 n=1 Tax=Oryza glaberrima TaxID=4538 RepID=UPI00224BF15F|nr:B3 domain-containing protein Os03g0212300-like isoform X2 [Oryza glaberrima]
MEEQMSNLRLANFEFFTIIQPGSSRTKLLPDEFARELEGEERELRDAKLLVAGVGRRRRGRMWDVKVVADDGGAYLGRGWLRFARAHGLRDGDLLVFRYDGAAAFTVTVFDDGTMCRRAYHDAAGSGSSSDDDGNDGRGEAAATSQFVVTLRQGNLGKKQAQYLNVPVEFQEAHGYAAREKVVLRMLGRSWTVRLKHTKGRRPRRERAVLRYGWHRFCADNGLAVGDTCFFRALRSAGSGAGDVDDGDGDHVLSVTVHKADGGDPLE